jgi:hypothetical protein
VSLLVSELELLVAVLLVSLMSSRPSASH